MKTPTKILAGVLMLLLLLPSSLFIAPRPAHALFGLGDIVLDPSNLIKNTITAAASLISSSGIASLQLKEYVLDPIAWAVSQSLISAMTGSIINFVNGKGSGGSPLFVRDIGQFLLQAGDSSALNFFGEITQSSNSPFSAILSSSLRTNYLQSTSAAGFWAANQCTLNQVSPNINAFLGMNGSAANFNQGGWATWFALQLPQNNPISQYYTLQSELNSRVSTIQTNHKFNISNGAGFTGVCMPGAASAAGAAATPSQSCQTSTGTPGVISTPGAAVHDYLSKSLGSGIDKLVSADEIDEIVGQLVSSLMSSVLGGTGLFGTSFASAGGTALTDQLRTTAALSPGNAGTLSGQVTNALMALQAQVLAYQNNWQTIGSAAQSAQSALGQLSLCYDAAEAQNALTTEVQPVIAAAQAAATTAATTLAAIAAAITQSQSATTPDAITQASASLQTVSAMPPTAAQIAGAQANSQVTDTATSASATSLTVAGGTTIDQMNLLALDARNALAVCQTGP